MKPPVWCIEIKTLLNGNFTKMVNERNRPDCEQRLIAKMTMILDEFIKTNEELIIVQEDKGNITVIMDKCEYKRLIKFGKCTR